MTGAVLRAGAWPAVAGISGAAVVVGGCGAAFPAAATVLLPVCFTLLAAAAAFTLDEPASLVVDVTPTGPARRTTIRAVALLAPLAAGAVVLLAAALRGLALPWAAAGLALAGNVLAGFAVACVLRTRTGEPGPAAGTAVVLVLMAPALVPQVARFVRTFPAPGAGGPSSGRSVGSRMSWRAGPENWIGGMRFRRSASVAGSGAAGRRRLLRPQGAPSVMTQRAFRPAAHRIPPAPQRNRTTCRRFLRTKASTMLPATSFHVDCAACTSSSSSRSAPATCMSWA